MKMFFNIIGMFILGVAGLAVQGYLVEVRDGRAVPPASLETKADASPLAAMGDGLLKTMEHTVTKLKEGKRSEAVHALDATMRVAKVASNNESGDTYHNAHKEIKKVRRYLQNGNTSKAIATLEKSVEDLRPALESSTEKSSPPTQLAKYKGASVVNAQGVRIGEVIGASAQELTIRAGAPRDVFGIIDFTSGEVITVKADEVVFGKHQAIGSTMVGLPTAETGNAIASASGSAL